MRLKKEREENARREAERKNAEIRSVHERFMRAALEEAQKAAALKEVPIGCVIVKNAKIIARGYNRRNTDANTLSHAELNAIRDASHALGDWRLEGCTLYVTLEPCQMCAGAIVQSRIDEVVIGCMNPKAGCAGSVLNLMQVPAFNHQVKITRGILEEACSSLISRFFENLRSEKADSRKP
ncbi:MAG: tRNA adenosine(34) deaminase TadA [Bilifractor sp.]|nr:tRNA adenosine(34) deaminase TadA [Bilifractor sp.]